MFPQPKNSEGSSALEEALGRLAPRAAHVDRDRVMFLAGQAAKARAGRRRLPVWAASLILVAGVAGIFGHAAGRRLSTPSRSAPDRQVASIPTGDATPAMSRNERPEVALASEPEAHGRWSGSFRDWEAAPDWKATRGRGDYVNWPGIRDGMGAGAGTEPSAAPKTGGGQPVAYLELRRTLLTRIGS